MSQALKKLVQEAPKAVSLGARGIRTGAAAKSGDHGHHSTGVRPQWHCKCTPANACAAAQHWQTSWCLQSYEDYIHAPHMYNIDRMTHKKLKFGLGCASVLGLGLGIPFFAVHFQNSKMVRPAMGSYAVHLFLPQLMTLSRASCRPHEPQLRRNGATRVCVQ